MWKRIGISAAVIAALVAVYYNVVPANSVFVPKCPIKMLTTLSCPSCGAQRFMHALFNGNIAEAFAYNYFLVIALPYLIILFIGWILPKGNEARETINAKVGNRFVAYTYLCLYFIWFAIRNILGI
ncbi:MAG: DUF2752 domain-containing protein [Prevotellaceae bacterium]|nr:DUF2752 domain-containing protein [Candidatus Minthosoma caballi]